MKILKSVVMITLIFISISAIAQQVEKTVKTPEERAKRQLKAIQKECNLSNDQSIKVEEILLKTQNKLTTLKESKPARRGDKLKELKTISEDQNSEIEKVLTPEQFVKYKAMIEKQKEKVRDRMIERQGQSIEPNE